MKIRRASVLRLPAMKNLRDPSPGLLAHADKTEHLVEGSVSAVGLSSMQGYLHRDTHQAWIAEAKHVWAFHHQH
jgi:hypothetical protein